MKTQLITALTVLPLTLLGCTVEPGETSPTAAAPAPAHTICEQQLAATRRWVRGARCRRQASHDAASGAVPEWRWASGPGIL